MAESDVTHTNVRAIYAVKAVALVVILVSYLIIDRFVSPFGEALWISTVVGAALAGTLIVLARPSRIDFWLRASLALDVVVLSIVIHLAGGVDNVSTPLLYPALITLAGLLLTPLDAFFIALLSAVCYDVVVAGEYLGILPHLVDYGRPPHRQLATALPVNLFLLLYAWLVSFAVGRTRALYRRTEELRREAIHALSHDLKNPLSVIHGYARLMDAAPPSQLPQLSRGIERTAQQALDLVSNVLDAAAFEGRPVTPRVHAVDLKTLVDEVANRYRFAAEAAGLELTVDDGGGMREAQVDGQLIGRAVGNLISNAIKYTPSGGRVSVSLGKSRDHALIQVRDSGTGIAPEELPLLFKRYSRTSSARGIEGSGLGLYIVRCIAEAHGGTATATSKQGEGSTFTLAVPL